MASRDIHASVVRLRPAVHDRKKQGLVSKMIRTAEKKGVSAYVEDGHNRWPTVHRLDAVRLFRLALEKSSAGARYHAVAEEGMPVRAGGNEENDFLDRVNSYLLLKQYEKAVHHDEPAEWVFCPIYDDR